MRHAEVPNDCSRRARASCATSAGVVDRSDRGSCSSPARTRSRSSRRWCRPTSTRSPTAQGARSLLLTPQGKLDVAFRLLARRRRRVARLPIPASVRSSQRRSNRFRIRVKAEVIDRTDEWGMVSLIGPAAADAMPGAHPDGVHEHVAIDGARLVRTEHGFDIVGPQAAVDAITRELDRERCRRGGAESRTTRSASTRGIPCSPFDIDEQHDPAGGVPRARRGVVHQGLLPRPGAGVPHRQPRPREPLPPPHHRHRRRVARARHRDRRRGKVVGEITSVAPPELGVGALGYVRHEVEPGTDAELRSETGTARASVTAIANGGSCGRIVIVIPDCTTMPVSASVVPTPELVSTLTF